MDINRGTLNDLFTGFKAALREGLGMANLPADPIATSVPSSTAIEKYPFLFLLSTMRQWFGPRFVQNVEGKVLEVENDDYEHTVGVPGNDIEDDQLGMYSMLMRKMGQDAGNLWGRLAINAYIANGNWLDGSAFFLTNRKFGDQTINNKTTSALSDSTFNTAYSTMMGYRNHAGQPLGIIPSLLVVGPANRTVGYNIVKNTKVASGDSTGVAIDNVNATAGVDMLVHPHLVGDYANYWFLLATTGVVKPCLVQKRKEGALKVWDKDDHENVKNSNRYDYGLHYRGKAALTLPPLAYGGLKTA